MSEKKDRIVRINKDQAKRIAGFAIYGTAVVLAVLIVFAYGLGSKNSFAKGISRVLHLPAAFVGSKAVPLSDYYDSLALADKASESAVSRKKVLEQMLENRVALDLAQEQDLIPQSQELEQAYQDLVQLTGEGSPGARYGLAKADFISYVVKPATVHNNLAVTLANNQELNKDAYQKLNKAKQELASGAKFEDLVTKYSDDALSSQIGGDLGFITARDLVPEYYKTVVAVKDNEVHTVTTRHGIYLYRLVNKDESNGVTRYRVKHIFFKTQDYEQWLQGKAKEYKILKLV